MKIALTRKNRYNNTTPSYESPTAKKTSNTRPHLQFKISPLDGAQYANISSNIKQTTKNNNASTIKKKEKTQHAHNHKEDNSNQPSQNYYYSQFYFKTNQTRPSGAARTAKRTKEALRQIFKTIITI